MSVFAALSIRLRLMLMVGVGAGFGLLLLLTALLSFSAFRAISGRFPATLRRPRGRLPWSAVRRARFRPSSAA
jgi:hypothetical protein